MKVCVIDRATINIISVITGMFVNGRVTNVAVIKLI